MSLVSDLINEAFLDLTVITVGETISPAMQTDAFMRINQLLASLSAEGAMCFNQVSQGFNLLTGVTAYTLGAGGSFATTAGLRAQKVKAWRAYYSILLHSGGAVLSLAEFGAQAKQLMGETTPIPGIVGADTAYPLINLKVFPPPSATPGVIELDYWTPIAQFLTVGDTVALPPGYEAMLHFALARELYEQYPRPTKQQSIWAQADRTKAAIISQNTMEGLTPGAPVQTK